MNEWSQRTSAACKEDSDTDISVVLHHLHSMYAVITAVKVIHSRPLLHSLLNLMFHSHRRKFGYHLVAVRQQSRQVVQCSHPSSINWYQQKLGSKQATTWHTGPVSVVLQLRLTLTEGSESEISATPMVHGWLLDFRQTNNDVLYTYVVNSENKFYTHKAVAS